VNSKFKVALIEVEKKQSLVVLNKASKSYESAFSDLAHINTKTFTYFNRISNQLFVID
jgi:hypothetical protein